MRDLRVALEEATASLLALYEQQASVEAVNGHRINVTIVKNAGLSKIRAVDLFLDATSGKIRVEFVGGSRAGLVYVLSADYGAAFLLDEKQQRVDADEVSRRILEPIFFYQPLSL